MYMTKLHNLCKPCSFFDPNMEIQILLNYFIKFHSGFAGVWFYGKRKMIGGIFWTLGITVTERTTTFRI